MIKVTYIDHMGDDLSVVNAARVSFGKKSKMHCVDHTLGTYVLPDIDIRLIQYLARHKHMSPFGHAFASFHVKAPMFVARQLVKHKFLRWNEISRRYVDDDLEFYLPDNWREKAKDKKQGSGSGFVNTLLQDDREDYPEDKSYMADYWEVNTSRYVEDNVYGPAFSVYVEMLNAGVCPEQARMVLPQSMMTEWYWSGSLDAWSDMCLLRCASDTQEETQYVASKISLKMHELFPHSWDALAKGRH